MDSGSWISGDDGKICNTMDGGKTWETQETGVNKGGLALFCLEVNTCWIDGEKGEVFVTHDGGANFSF